MPPSMTSSHRQLLEWIAAQPRTYAEVMDAWRSTCPKLTIWEDVLDRGLVRVERGDGTMDRSKVVLTPAGALVVANDTN